jgi:membrane-associated phospholipid phosphatase
MTDASDGPRHKLGRRLLIGLVLVAAAFALDHADATTFLRSVLRWESWGEMTESLTAAKFLASGLGTLAIAVAVAAVDRRRWRRALVLAVVVVASGLVNSALKMAIGRERPSHLDQAPGQERVLSFHGPAMGIHNSTFQSFPSGHTASAFAIATCLATFYPAAAPVTYTVAAWAGVNRVVSHQHFPSDVVAGALVGHVVSLWLLGLPALRRRWESVRVDRSPPDT